MSEQVDIKQPADGQLREGERRFGDSARALVLILLTSVAVNLVKTQPSFAAEKSIKTSGQQEQKRKEEVSRMKVSHEESGAEYQVSISDAADQFIAHQKNDLRHMRITPKALTDVTQIDSSKHVADPARYRHVDLPFYHELTKSVSFTTEEAKGKRILVLTVEDRDGSVTQARVNDEGYLLSLISH